MGEFREVIFIIVIIGLKGGILFWYFSGMISD